MANTQFNNTNFTGKNVLFLQGSQDNLNNLIKNGGATEGAFYLTNDTHRLYIGRSLNGKVYPVAVNEGVVTVQKASELSADKANAGEFFFITEGTILCVFNGQDFIQINHDSDTTNSSLTTAISAVDNVATITTTVIDSDNNPVTDTFYIKDSANAAIITANADDKILDIKTDKYTLNASNVTDGGADINLISANTDNDTTIKLIPGENVSINAAGNNITIASSYHDTKNETVGVELTSEGKIQVTVTDSDNVPKSGSSAAIIYQVGGVDYVPGSQLPVYTTAQVDKKFNDLNGLTYRSTATAVPSGDISNGDMWMASADIDIPAAKSATQADITAHKGDLLIAQGAENDNGIIPSSNVKFAVVPAGDDAETDTTYKMILNAAANEWSIENSDESVIGSVKVAAGTDIAVSSAKENNKLTTTIAHAKLHETKDAPQKKTPAMDAPTNALIVTAVTGVKVSTQGHVEEVITTDIGIKDSTYKLEGGNVSVANDKKSATITTKLVDQDNNPSEFAHTLKSSTLSFSTESSTNNVVVNLTWGSF